MVCGEEPLASPREITWLWNSEGPGRGLGHRETQKGPPAGGTTRGNFEMQAPTSSASHQETALASVCAG
jgi:hypothetical protein